MQSSRCNRSGFTLIEIMLVIMLLVLFTFLVLIPALHLYKKLYPTPQTVAGRALGVSDKPSQSDAPSLSTDTNELALSLQNALKFYKLDNGFYPTEEQGLNALVKKPVSTPIPKHWTPYLKSVPPCYYLDFEHSEPVIKHCTSWKKHHEWLRYSHTFSIYTLFRQLFVAAMLPLPANNSLIYSDFVHAAWFKNTKDQRINVEKLWTYATYWMVAEPEPCRQATIRSIPCMY